MSKYELVKALDQAHRDAACLRNNLASREGVIEDLKRDLVVARAEQELNTYEVHGHDYVQSIQAHNYTWLGDTIQFFVNRSTDTPDCVAQFNAMTVQSVIETIYAASS